MSQLPTAKADTMRPWLTSLAIGCLVSVSACGGYANTVTVAATPQRLVGRIEVTGSAPAILVTLVLGNGGAVNLGGELREELRNLSGAEVEVGGDGTAVGLFAVTAYEVLAINGQRPVVGVISIEKGGREVWVEGERRVRLVNPPSSLRNQAGAKVWIVGRPADGGLQLQSFGIIRRPE